jgi:integrase
VAGYIEDRWVNKTLIDPKTKRKKHTDRYGKGKRYKVDGIPGVKPALFDTLRDAEKWKAKAIAEVSAGTWLDPRDGNILLKDYIDEYWRPGYQAAVSSKLSAESYIKNQIVPDLGSLPLRMIVAQPLREWLVDLNEDYDPNTVISIWQLLSGILSTAVDDGRIPRNPCTAYKKVRPPKKGESKADAFTAQQVMDVRAGLREWYRICVDLGVRCGLRQAEVLGLSPDDVDEINQVIHVRRQLLWDPNKPYVKLPKGDKVRDVPLSPDTAARIAEHRKLFPPLRVTLPWRGPGRPGGGKGDVAVNLLISTRPGNPGGGKRGRRGDGERKRNPVNRSTWNVESWKPALAAAGIIAAHDPEAEGSGWEPSREYGFHRCRHTFASVMLDLGMESIVTVSKWMGHSSPTVTLSTYAHFMPSAGAKGMPALDAWLTVGQDQTPDSP